MTPAPSRAAPASGPQKLRILVSQSTSALPFLLLAKENPLPGVSLTVDVYASHPQALALPLRGDAQLLLTGTSQGWENRLDGKERGLLRLATYADAWAGVSAGDGRSPQVSLFATTAFAGSQRDLLVALVDSWRKATLRVREDPARASALFAALLAADPAVLEESIGHTLLEVPSFSDDESRVFSYY